MPGIPPFYSPGSIEFEIEAEFPEWIFPYVKVVLYFKTEEAWEESAYDYFSLFNLDYFFQKIRDKETYKLYGRVNGIYKNGTYIIPTFINLHIYIFNERLNCELQTKQT